MQEIRLLKRISFDRNIVQFYGACLESQPPMLVMEYMGVCPSLQPASTCALPVHDLAVTQVCPLQIN